MNPEDVENSAWHYLCNARANTPKKAREDLIPVTKDTRVPMKEVLELFAGKLKPQDVIDAAEKAKLKGERLKSARFYAHLYVGAVLRDRGRREEGARTPHGGRREVQDRRLHVGRGRRPPEDAEGEEEITTRRHRDDAKTEERHG